MYCDMDDTLFQKLFVNVCNEVITFVDELIDNGNTALELEDNVDGTINIFHEGVGVYVLSRQRYTHEIWLSSPISGPHHFKYRDSYWIDKNGNRLDEIIEKQLGG